MSDEIRNRQWLDQQDSWMRDTVRKHGWAIQAVFGEGTDPPFTYTVGLFGFRHPELVIFGMPHESAGGVLNELGERVRQGGRIAPGELQTFENWSHRLHVFPLADPSKVLFAANRFYGRRTDDPVPGLQLVWDDRWGNFPWEPRYDPPGWLQPLPGTFAA
jgi:hypothetical protein